MVVKMLIPGELQEFIDEYAGDYYTLKLVLFFAAFPNTRFNSQAIFGLLGSLTDKRYMEKALSKLVEYKVTKVDMYNPAPVYRLCDDLSKRSRVIQIGNLDPIQKHELLRELGSV